MAFCLFARLVRVPFNYNLPDRGRGEGKSERDWKVNERMRPEARDSEPAAETSGGQTNKRPIKVKAKTREAHRARLSIQQLNLKCKANLSLSLMLVRLSRELTSRRVFCVDFPLASGTFAVSWEIEIKPKRLTGRLTRLARANQPAACWILSLLSRLLVNSRQLARTFVSSSTGRQAPKNTHLRLRRRSRELTRERERGGGGIALKSEESGD